MAQFRPDPDYSNKREQRQAEEMAQLMEEVDLTEDENNGYESGNNSVGFEIQ